MRRARNPDTVDLDGVSPIRLDITDEAVARTTLDGIVDESHESVADDISKQVLAGLSGGIAALYPQLIRDRGRNS